MNFPRRGEESCIAADPSLRPRIEVVALSPDYPRPPSAEGSPSLTSHFPLPLVSLLSGGNARAKRGGRPEESLPEPQRSEDFPGRQNIQGCTARTFQDGGQQDIAQTTVHDPASATVLGGQAGNFLQVPCPVGSLQVEGKPGCQPRAVHQQIQERNPANPATGSLGEVFFQARLESEAATPGHEPRQSARD